ncbi:MAG: hypothetical protein ACN23H_01070 [Candidatus Phytoplasma vitis]|nr:MAG: hypothetical protein M6G77_00945 [Candidatus Phytoplasma vitis]
MNLGLFLIINNNFIMEMKKQRKTNFNQ